MVSTFKRGKLLNATTGEYEWYRSSYEQVYMDKLNTMSCVVSWTTKHDIVIPYTSDDGKSHRYFPDFLVKYLDGRIELVEIKGWVKDVKSFQLKCAAGELYCTERNIKYRVLFKKELMFEQC